MSYTNTRSIDFYRNKVLLTLIMLAFIIPGCFNFDDDLAGDAFGPWIIPSEEIVSLNLLPGAIPSIETPQFAEASQTSYVNNNRLVLGVRVGDVIKAYPHQVIDWHETVNDLFGGTAVAITHSPLSGTGLAWNREINGDRHRFSAAGMIFRNNSIFADENTGSHWLQMQFRSVNGELSGTIAETFQVVETTWETWQAMFPESRVLTTQTGSEIDYNNYVLGEDYIRPDNTETYTSVKNSDDRLLSKERVHGIVSGLPAEETSSVKVYVIDNFDTGVEVIQDNIDGNQYVVAGSSGSNFAVAFNRMLEDGTMPEFSAVQGNLPEIMQDNDGNIWDIFGYAVEGPREGERLTPANSYTGYWFAWADLYPGLEIYGLN